MVSGMKNTRGSLGYIVPFVLALSFLFLVSTAAFAGEDSWFGKLKAKAGKIADDLVSTFSEGSYSSNEDSKLYEAMDVMGSFVKAISLDYKEEKDCFVKYSSFTDYRSYIEKIKSTSDSLEGMRLMFKQSGDDIVVTLVKKPSFIEKKEIIKNKQLCIVGEGSAEPFADNFIVGKTNTGGYFTDVDAVYFEDDYFRVKKKGSKIIDSYEYDRLDYGLMFVADNKRVCFIGTDDWGFARDCFDGKAIEDECLACLRIGLDNKGSCAGRGTGCTCPESTEPCGDCESYVDIDNSRYCKLQPKI